MLTQQVFTLRFFYGGIAQLGEHLPCKQGVRSSNLLISTNDLTEISDFVVGQVPFCFKSSICQKTANDFLKVKNDLTKGQKNIENRITVYISGQETKGARRMPWHQEAKKDVTSNENLE